MESKVAVVTGGSRGIGKACALRLAKDGYDIAVNYAGNDAAAAETAKEIEKLGVRAMTFKADTSDIEAVKAMFTDITNRLGVPEVLVNNAGVVNDAYLLMVTEESLDKGFDVNVKGYFHCAQQAALKMMKNRHGSIINISSVSGTLALEGQSVYSATKGAVNSMTAVLAKELARYGIRVNGVAPGFVKTEMIDAIPEEKRKEYLKNIPMKRFCDPEEIAGVVSALAGEVFGYMTGQILVLDGGLSL